MILKQDKDKIIRLNGEPLDEWFTARRIKPIRYAYIEKGDGTIRKLCLTAAVGFASCEARLSYEGYKRLLHSWSFEAAMDQIAFMTGETQEDLKCLEAGWVGIGPVDDHEIAALGWEAWRQVRRDSRPAWGEHTLEPDDPRHPLHAGE